MTRPDRDHGYALLHAIFFVGLIATSIALLTSSRLARARDAMALHSRVQALYAAEAGIAEAIAALDRGDPGSHLEGAVGFASYRVRLAPVAEGGVTIRSTGEHDGRSRIVVVQGRLAGESFEVLAWH